MLLCAVVRKSAFRVEFLHNRLCFRKFFHKNRVVAHRRTGFSFRYAIYSPNILRLCTSPYRSICPHTKSMYSFVVAIFSLLPRNQIFLCALIIFVNHCEFSAAPNRFQQSLFWPRRICSPVRKMQSNFSFVYLLYNYSANA